MAEEIGEQQIAEFSEAFKFFDKDGDGMIQTDELDMLIRSLNINLTEMELDKIKSDIDPDNTGNVDLPEFLALMTTIYKPVDAEKELLEAFKVLQGEYTTYNIQALKHVTM